eukprot:362917-Chlamydomonas_euryale.AAC.4
MGDTRSAGQCFGRSNVRGWGTYALIRSAGQCFGRTHVRGWGTYALIRSAGVAHGRMCSARPYFVFLENVWFGRADEAGYVGFGQAVPVESSFRIDNGTT